MGVRDLLSPFTAWKYLFRDPVSIRDPLDAVPRRHRAIAASTRTTTATCASAGRLRNRSTQNGAIDMMPVDDDDDKQAVERELAAIDYAVLLVRPVRRCLHDQIAHDVERLPVDRPRSRRLPLTPGVDEEEMG